MVLWMQRTNSHRLQKSGGEKGQHGHRLSKRAPQSLPGQAFIAFWEHYVKEGSHSLCSGSKDQTIDNIQRTMRASSESGSVSQRAIKLWETNSFHAWTLIRKLMTFLAKQVSQDFAFFS